MDKNAIKKYAIWARRELIERVSQRAMFYGISAEGTGDPNTDSVNGHLLSPVEKRQLQALIQKINDNGYEQVMEEVAYTWFNRFAAIRFMEVNGYLPSHIRVFTNDVGEFKPQILTEAIHLELDGLDMDKVYEMENANKREELFKYLLIVQCNALNSILPGMFQRIEDYTELLLPDYLLRENSVIEQMVTVIPEEDWTNQVQIIGWLYQYYNTEPKAKVFAKPKGVKIQKEEIPAATQLFTPDWIVHYMVENSLGRLWLEGHANDALKSEWKYYLDEAEQEKEVQEQLAVIKKEYAELKPEDIRVIDPCMGSGHILCVLFDVLVRIYEDYGYTAREAVVLIIEKNLWGLDIDERAKQLAYFSVMMKARQYDRRFFSRGIQPQVYAIQESNNLDPHCIEYFVDGRNDLNSAMSTLVEELHDAKEYGSILKVSWVDFDALYNRFEDIRNETKPHLYSYQAIDMLLPFVQMAQTMAQKYHVVTTNPPYMSVTNGDKKLNEFIKRNYFDERVDLYSVFIDRCASFCRKNGYQAMITQHGWMFLGSFESMRKKALNRAVINVAHLGTRSFEEIGGEVVQTVAFVMRNTALNYRGTYSRLIDFNSQDKKELAYINGEQRFVISQERYKSIPGSPVAYWFEESVYEAFAKRNPLSFYAEPKVGFQTGDNEKYLRLWFEPDYKRIGFGFHDRDEAKESRRKWFPCNKGGAFRKWYGNFDYVVNWENDGYEMRNQKGSYIRNPQYYFKDGLTWSTLASELSMRYSPVGVMFETKGSVCFIKDEKYRWYLLGLLNSRVTRHIMQALSPTLDFHEGPMGKMPVIIDTDWMEEINSLVIDCINLCNADWDSREYSWNFSRHPLLPAIDVKNDSVVLIQDIYNKWKEESKIRFEQLKKNEERLNDIFITIYRLNDTLDSQVNENEISVYRADVSRDVKSLISYAVGCMFGRYSLKTAGLIIPSTGWENADNTVYPIDRDNIIPICDDDYFADDIVGRFVDFVKVVYGEKNLEENLRFIANALGGKGSSREVIRNYFISGFYENHLKVYQRRPIYWLFDSGKKNGFKCLIYMHRYQQDTIARVRTDYVHEQQSRYRTAIADLEQRIENATGSERVKLSKQLTKLQDQADEVRVYEEKLHHLADQMIEIDLDDGVKHNYALFKDVLAKIK